MVLQIENAHKIKEIPIENIPTDLFVFLLMEFPLKIYRQIYLYFY
jgi:hypothetical protein